MQIKVYATLRPIVGGKVVILDGLPANPTVEQMLLALLAKYPAMRNKLYLENGEMHSAFHILINGRDVRFREGLQTVLAETDEVRIFPPVGGGAR